MDVTKQTQLKPKQQTNPTKFEKNEEPLDENFMKSQKTITISSLVIFSTVILVIIILIVILFIQIQSSSSTGGDGLFSSLQTDTLTTGTIQGLPSTTSLAAGKFGVDPLLPTVTIDSNNTITGDLAVNKIEERTTDQGVTIESVLLKDNSITTQTLTISGSVVFDNVEVNSITSSTGNDLTLSAPATNDVVIDDDTRITGFTNPSFHIYLNDDKLNRYIRSKYYTIRTRC